MAKDTYKYAKSQMTNDTSVSTNSTNIPDGSRLNKYNVREKDLRPEKRLGDSLFNAAGLYSKEDIEKARFTRYSRFGRVLDPYGRLNPGREYLFFVKPDLHIVVPYGLHVSNFTGNSVYSIGNFGSKSEDAIAAEEVRANDMTLNPQLQNAPYFVDLLKMHPNTIKELQYSAQSKSIADPFIHSLSFGVNSNLPLDSVSTETLDNPATVYGTSYKYVRDSEASDENYSFSLEFVDNKNLDIYHFFKAYSEYHIARKTGFVTPPDMSFYQYKRLHNTMGIYKFIVAEDMETLVYWAYLWGAYPTSVPRDAFQDPTFPDGNGLTFTVNFEAAFIEDMNPLILSQFNSLMQPYLLNNGCTLNNWLPIVRQNITDKHIKVGNTTIVNPGYDLEVAPNNEKADIIDGTLPIGALVDGRRVNDEPNQKYRLRWYAPGTMSSSRLSGSSYNEQTGEVDGYKTTKQNDPIVGNIGRYSQQVR